MIRMRHHDVEFASLVRNLPMLNSDMGPWIAGGSARKLAQGVPWQSGDVDVFFQSAHQMANWRDEFEHKMGIRQPVRLSSSDMWDLTGAITQSSHAVADLGSRVVSMTPMDQTNLWAPGDLKYWALCQLKTDNAISYTVFVENERQGFNRQYKLQIIQTRYHDSLIKLWQHFDFTISCFAADEHEVTCTPTAWSHMQERLLQIQPDGHSNHQALRVLKHYIYGFDAPTSMLKQAAQDVISGKCSWNMDY